MARPGFRNHRKFRRLVATLRIPEAHALGYVEMMWNVAYETGSPYLGDLVDVELAAGWDGEPGALCQALVACGGIGAGLIDEVEPGTFQVHDLLDHAPDYVGDRAKRVQEAQQDKPCDRCGDVFHSPDPRARFCSETCRKMAWKQRQVTEGDGQVTEVTEGDAGVRHQKSPTVPGDAEVTEGDAEGRKVTESDGIPSPAQPSPAPFKRLKDTVAEKPARPPRVPAWGKAHPSEVLEAAQTIVAMWPHHKTDVQPVVFDPKKPPQPVPVTSAPDLAKRLGEIKKAGGDLEICKLLAERAVREWRSEGKWIKAAQHWFGKTGPWEAYYQAHVTNQARAEQPIPAEAS